MRTWMSGSTGSSNWRQCSDAIASVLKREPVGYANRSDVSYQRKSEGFGGRF